MFAQRTGDVLVIRVTAFNHSTDSHLAHAIEQGLAGSHPPSGIVLDLRGNRGGLLRQAVTAADTLLPAGVVVTTAGRDPEATRIWRSNRASWPRTCRSSCWSTAAPPARRKSSPRHWPTAAAPWWSAASTLGKGLVQTIAPLPDGGELFVTWSRVLAPRGWPIQGLGVLPQVCTSLGKAPLTSQLAALAEGAQPMAQAIATHRGARAPLPPAQILAIRSACPAAEGRELRPGRRAGADPRPGGLCGRAAAAAAGQRRHQRPECWPVRHAGGFAPGPHQRALPSGLPPRAGPWNPSLSDGLQRHCLCWGSWGQSPQAA